MFYKNRKNISPNGIKNVLSSVNPECRNNVEFSEGINEIIYILIIENTYETLRQMVNLHEDKFTEIKFNLENPVHNGINVKKALKFVLSVSENNEITEEIIKSIKIAVDKL